MDKSLLTIDWDYFIRFYNKEIKSYQESEYNVMNEWYKDYMEYQEKKMNIKNFFGMNQQVHTFWEQLARNVHIKEDEPILLTDSHKEAYDIAKENECSTVYSIDTHSDLGYGGIQALEFEINCANWLGKLLKQGIVKKAYIIYSPYTYENQEDFEEIIKKYNIEFLSLEAFYKKKIKIDKVHVCRSGSWTPPWYDGALYKFLMQSQRQITGNLYELRKWKPQALTLAEQIECMLGI